jgi:8-oxo-dGTP pyrophosphatase MutT (NUDIX family)
VAEIPQGTVRTDDSELITPRSSATVVVYRRIGPQYEYLVLHRAHYGPDFAGAWAWGPPSGTRQPDEDVDQCAAREVFEETGLRLTLQPVGRGALGWARYLAEAAEDAAIRLSHEHDRFVWLPRDQAVDLVTPAEVRAQLLKACSLVESCDPV